LSSPSQEGLTQTPQTPQTNIYPALVSTTDQRRVFLHADQRRPAQT